MADLSQHVSYTGAYSGLLDNLWVTLAVAGVCFVGNEIGIHIPRRRGRDGTFQHIPVRIFFALRRVYRRWRSPDHTDGPKEIGRESSEQLIRPHEPPEVAEERRRLGDREAWEYGYIYQPKAWALKAGPPVSAWPLAWIWTSLAVRERDMPERCGLDLTLHARFLRGSFFYTLLQACIVLPILLPLHIFYAPNNVDKTSMLRAGISSLVDSSGAKWLWVHAILIWWISITWTATVLWITWGGLAYRRRELNRLEKRVNESRKAKQMASGNEEAATGLDRWSVRDDCEGIKRFRTLMWRGLSAVRDEGILRDYFDYYIHRHRARLFTKGGKFQAGASKIPQVLDPLNPIKVFKKRSEAKRAAELPPTLAVHSPTEEDLPATAVNPSPAAPPENNDEVIVDDENDELETEVDDVILVRKLGSLVSLRERRTKVLKELETAHVLLARRVLKAVKSHKGKEKAVDQDAAGTEAVVIGATDAEKGTIKFTRKDRLDKLTAALGSFVGDEPDQLGQGKETVWDVLHSLPRQLLDPYQALTHLKVTNAIRKQNAPLIDFLTMKLAYLTTLLDEARSQPLSSYTSASTAFVTFKDAKTARLALKILDSHPKRSLACHTTPATDWTDLLWNRLGKSTYRSEFVRNWVVYVLVWIFTLIWIFPVSLFVALTTLTNIGGFIPVLKDWLAKNPKAASAISSLAPVFLVALLTISICPILLVIANKAETIVTRLGIHNSVLERFWKFLMVNGVIFFAIGQTAIEAYLTAFQDRDFDPLPLVASAFPTAAPYFASYILLQVAIQPCFEVFRFGLPTIVYVFGTRTNKIPRKRFGNTEHPTFSHFSQVPYQLLGGAIMHLFMLLNPLVIPFTLVYYGMCYLVWKRQFTYVYGRLYENNGRRTSIRVLRYSLDALALGQFVLFAFFILSKAKGNAGATGVLFFLTLGAKLIITRALKRRHDNLDAEEADILCPPVPSDGAGDGEGEGDDATRNEPSFDGHEGLKDSREISPDTSTQSTLQRLRRFIDKWVYASSHRNVPAGYRKPIPFDHLLFARLDRRINFPLEESEEEKQHGHAHLVTDPVSDKELQHPPDQPISHPAAPALVVPHHPLRPWEDIPPYQRSRGYEDQPAYTDDYDDFLWLPRDPLSTLDLDDTVEMRLSLTSSAGGSGKFGDWPPEEEDEEVEDTGKAVAIAAHEGEPEVVIDPPSPVQAISEPAVSPQHSTRPLMGSPPPPSISSDQGHGASLELPSDIGTEAEDSAAAQLFRTIRMRQSISRAFRRPRADTQGAEDVFRISSRTSTHSTTLPPATTPIVAPEVHDSPQDEIPLTELLRGRQPAPSSRPTTPQEMPITAPLPGGSGSQISFGGLGRTPDGRRPHASFAEPTPTTDVSRGSMRFRDARSPSLRFASHAKRDRSTSILSAAQHALLAEVMEEERKAAKEHKREEKVDREKEEAEVRREKERASTDPTTGGSGANGDGEEADAEEREMRRRGSSFGAGRRGSRFQEDVPNTPGGRRVSRPNLRSAGSQGSASGSFSSDRRRTSRAVSTKSSLGDLRTRTPASGSMGPPPLPTPPPPGGGIEMRQITAASSPPTPNIPFASITAPGPPALPTASPSQSGEPSSARPELVPRSSVPQIPSDALAIGTPIAEPFQKEVEKIMEKKDDDAKQL